MRYPGSVDSVDEAVLKSITQAYLVSIEVFTFSNEAMNDIYFNLSAVRVDFTTENAYLCPF